MAQTILNVAEKPSVSYCIDLWLRDEQIRLNLASVTGRVEPNHEPRTEPIAIACFGPSLQTTWEQIKDFPYVMSCSGSHKFLVDRGITPTYHVEVDPRAHKTGLMGEPQDATEYLIASTCHPQVIEHLKGKNVKLWHVFDTSEEGNRLLPHGEWALTGGCDVGLRAMTMAAFLGFRDIHIFGMDQSAGTVDAPTTARHAAAHPNSGKKFSTVEYEGVTYLTTPAMLAAAQGVLHELDQMPKVTATFHGEGLCQHMVRTRKPATEAKPFANVVGMIKPSLISVEYAALNAQLHKQNLAYGVGGGKHAETVQRLTESLKTTSVLDYGCGKGYMAKALSFPIWEYDPAIPGKQDSPRPADIVVCTDVLEHIEPDKLTYVLADLRRCVRKVGYFVIHTGPAAKTLPDGRNTHLIQEGKAWWKARLKEWFALGVCKVNGKELHFIVGPKGGRAPVSVMREEAVLA